MQTFDRLLYTNNSFNKIFFKKMYGIIVIEYFSKFKFQDMLEEYIYLNP